MSVVTTVPREQTNQETSERLNEAPAPPLQAPAPSGQIGGFQPKTQGGGVAAQLEAFLRTGDNAAATVAITDDSAFTKDELEVKNQARVTAWNTGPYFPQGASSGAGANAMQPFVNAPFNRERLNSGEQVRTALGNPYLRGLGNAFGDRLNASNWAAMTHIQVDAANTDPSGFAQVNHTGNFIPDRETTYQPERGFRPGGPLYGTESGDPNSGAAFTKLDGAAGGAAGFASLSAQTAAGGEFAMQPPSGAGALYNPDAYGISALLS
jgi:hypothetical protein